ncbi:apicomplexan specific [Cryptosporidium sp. chipmunk genotype I]|uniref:apicomplexan specific n=1 Tax=Cryptosporidium sp. chipmunk genotype I TaxID=1280935 RepID=UPI00351A553E|nr:apicomplexan specific [Cryptosporidium sp. chipmunk genotype I]
MTEPNNDLNFKDDNEKELQRKGELKLNLISQNCNMNIRDRLQGNMSYTSNGKDEIFMQLQTELFDILLEIYNIIPTWGSFKENFYFHWKRIIGACNFKDLHAYRLIFRCLGNLRPSSMPIFILRTIIKQLDEYRKISEPEYSPSNFELNPSIHGNLVTSSNTPIIMLQNTHAINTASAPIETKKKIFLEDKIGLDFSSNKCNSNFFEGMISENTKCLGLALAGINEANSVSLSLFESDILSSVSSQKNSNLFDNICNSMNKNLYFSVTRQQYDSFKNDNEKSPEEKNSKNEFFNRKENIFSDEYNTSEVINSPFILSNYCNSNSTVSSPYGSVCTISPFSPTEYNIRGPIIAAFQHVQAVATAATNNPKNKLNSANNLSNEQNTVQPKKRPRRNGEIQGVYFDKIRKLWRANWKENGRVKTKGFSVFQFGDEGARQRAIEYRKKMEKEFYIVPNSKLSRSSSSDGTAYINSEKEFQNSVSPKKKGAERSLSLNNTLCSSSISFEYKKFSENTNSNLNN